MININQGALGDSHFIAAVSAMTSKPKMIENLFINKKVNSKGKYTVILYVNGR